MRVVLYTRSNCHLCDEALAILKAHGLTPKCVDIDLQPDLRAAFDTCVPVVEINGKIRFRVRVDSLLLRRLIATKDRGEDLDG